VSEWGKGTHSLLIVTAKDCCSIRLGLVSQPVESLEEALVQRSVILHMLRTAIQRVHAVLQIACSA